MRYDTVYLTTDQFKAIIEFDDYHHQGTLERLLTYSYGIRAIQQQEYRNPVEMLRSSLQSKEKLLLELPLATEEIDAVCLQGNGIQYTLLNSSIPKIHTNYALCCAYFYSMTATEAAGSSRVKAFYSNHIHSQKDNLSASAFTKLFLLPESSLREMFFKFLSEQNTEDTALTILAKLMNYYEVPYPFMLTRCYSLGLLESGNTLETLLQITPSDIQKEFHRLWLDESLLRPTLKDDYARLLQLVKHTGKTYLEEEYLHQRTLDLAISNLQSLYKKVREAY